MVDGVARAPTDRRLHCVHRGIVNVLTAIASVLTLMWLVETGTSGDIPDDDATWYVSAGIRLLGFAGLAVLSFLATYRAQPAHPASGAMARPTPPSLRLRVLAAVCAALFFGDLAASAFAGQDGSWVAALETAVLGVLTLAAVVAVATGRVTLRLWSEAGGDMPVWSEPTEAEVNQHIPSVDAQTVWLGVLMVSWLLSHDLPPIIPLADPDHGATVTLMIQGLTLTLVAIAHYAKRELALCGEPYDSRARGLDLATAVLGTGISTEVAIRSVVSFDELPAVGFWISFAICLLGLVAGVKRFLKAVQSPVRRSD